MIRNFLHERVIGEASQQCLLKVETLRHDLQMKITSVMTHTRTYLSAHQLKYLILAGRLMTVPTQESEIMNINVAVTNTTTITWVKNDSPLFCCG